MAVVWFVLGALEPPKPKATWSANPELEPMLIREFVEGDMEVDEFERRLDAVFRDEEHATTYTLVFKDCSISEWSERDTLAHQRIAAKIEQLRRDF